MACVPAGSIFKHLRWRDDFLNFTALAAWGVCAICALRYAIATRNRPLLTAEPLAEFFIRRSAYFVLTMTALIGMTVIVGFVFIAYSGQRS